MKPKRLILISALVLVGVIILAVFRSGDNRLTAAPNNIILISIDTIRADHMSCYGYEHKTTPNIDAFAENAILFQHCFANIPLTLPSHATMLTGLIPPTHGVQDNLTMVLSDSVVTLPEMLNENGYATYGIISAQVLNHRYGLDQGFDVYDDLFESEIGKSQIIPQRLANETVDHAMKWLDENQDEKKFMFLHFYDPHDDYKPPAPYNRQFQRPYDGEIAFADHCIGQFLDKLKSLGKYDDSLIIIVGDHAELLGEHGEFTHSYFIYHNVLRVPLIIKPPGHTASIKINDNTTIPDITPTILAQCGIEIPDNIQGIDLSAYYNGADGQNADRVLFNECLTATKYNANSLLGVIQGQWHYIQTTRPELYDWVKDPGELNNLYAEQPQRSRILQQYLNEILEEAVSIDDKSETSLNFDELQALKGLGYVGGEVDTDLKFDQTKADPKDMLTFHNQLNEVMEFIHNEKYDKGMDICKKMIARYPDILPPYDLLTNIYFKTKEYDKAIDIVKIKLAKDPTDIDTLKIMVEAYYLAGKYELAIDQIKVILKMDPESKIVRDKLVEIYTEIKEYEKAIAVIEQDLAKDNQDLNALKALAKICIQAEFETRAIETINTILAIDPDDETAFAKLLDLHKKRQEDDKVMSLLEDRLDKSPDDIVALRYLAHTYHEQKKHSQAIAVIEEKILKIEPDNAEIYYLLAKSFRSLKQLPQALKNYNKTLELDADHLSASIAAGEICNKMGKLKEMIKHNKKALFINDDLPNSHNDIAWVQATSLDPKLYDPPSALIHARKAVKLAADPASDAHGYHAYYLDTLSIAQSANGQFEQAVKTATLAISLLKKANDNAAASEVQKHLNLFKAHKTYRE